MKLEIWDTAGQEKFAALAPLYYHGAHVALLVFDITQASSYDRAKFWVSELQQHGNEGVKIVLVGNKLDIAQRRAVPQGEAEEFARNNRFLYFEVSAKTGEFVQDLFVKAAVSAAEQPKDHRRNNSSHSDTVALESQARRASEKKSKCGGCGSG